MNTDKKAIVYEFTRTKIQWILNMKDLSAQKAILANLRRGIGHIPGEIPELWGLFLNHLPEECYGKNEKVSESEWAIYLALTFFALHQQGHDPKSDPMYKKENSLGKAIALLSHGEENDIDRIRRKFNQIATADTLEEAAWHIKSVIQLLRGESIPLDYASLAKDFYLFQYHDQKYKVCLGWGQNFYRNLMKEENVSNEEE